MSFPWWADVIAPIPKVKSVETMKHLRPISLCTVFYKIGGVMGEVITENQSAFLGGRLTSNNVLIAHELTYRLKTTREGQRHEMALKLDMIKAFDRVEWSFVEAIMLKLVQ